MKEVKKASKIQLLGQVIIYSVAWWFVSVIVIGAMDKTDVRLQAFVLALVFSIYLTADKNTSDIEE